MNVLVVIVVGILVLCMFMGYRAGLIKTIFSIFSMVVALILTMFISPYVSKALQSNEKIVDYFSQKVIVVLNLDEMNQTIQDKVEQIDKLPIPQTMKQSLKHNDTSETESALGATDFTGYLSRSIACMILNSLSFAITYVILIILLRVLCIVLNIISKLPVIHQINKMTGLAAGLIQGLIIVWLLCIVLVSFSGTGWGKSCYEMINQNDFLGLLYNNNLILKFVTDLTVGKIGI